MKLHLACGPRYLEGWTNVDILPGKADLQLDLRNRFPFAKNSVSFIYTEHFIEHLTEDDGLRFLKECHRVLMPKGVLRVSTPDLRHLIKCYLDRNLTEWEDCDWVPSSPCKLINEGLRKWGHLFTYDGEELLKMLLQAGFSIINSVAWNSSKYPELYNIETRPFHGELIMEAVK